MNEHTHTGNHIASFPARVTYLLSVVDDDTNLCRFDDHDTAPPSSPIALLYCRKMTRYFI